MSLSLSGTTGVTYPDGSVGSVAVPAGSVVQVVSTTKTDTFSSGGQAATTWQAITGLSVAITPSSSSNKVLVLISLGRVGVNSSVGCSPAFRLYRDSTAIGIGTPSSSRQGSSFVLSRYLDTNGSLAASFQFLDSPSTTSSVTYQMYLSDGDSVITYINRSAADTDTTQGYGSRGASTITAMEIKG